MNYQFVFALPAPGQGAAMLMTLRLLAMEFMKGKSMQA
jgi:hypothetical protein